MRCRAPAALCLLAAAALLLAARSAAAALFAVDLGAEFLKVSIVKPGRIPISIVINEMSKRKTPTLVGFVGGERLVGEEAASLEARHPDKIYSHLRDWLGRPADHPAMAALLKAQHLPHDVAPAENRTWAVAFRTDTGAAYSVEELVASLLEYAQRLASAAADGAPVADVVLVVPAYFTPRQRTALLDAGQLAGLNVLGLVHSHAAAALQYGIERDFTNRTEDVIFYDVGASSVQAALVRFSAYPDRAPGARQGGPAVSQFEVRDVAWALGTGGDELEAALVDHFATQFNAQLGGGGDVRASPKAMAKLRKQVKRTKQILSANIEAPLSVEELYEDRDFRASISREQFEALAGDFWERATAPLAALLARNNLSGADVAAVELLGGTSRVPRLKQALSEALGGRALDMHLDADEAVVLGAGLFAANLSTIFRLRKFGMADKAPYSVSFRLGDDEAGERAAQLPGGGAAPGAAALACGVCAAAWLRLPVRCAATPVAASGPPNKVLVPALKRIPTKRGIYPANVTGDAFSVSLAYDNAPGAILEVDHISSELGRFTVSGIDAVVAKYNQSGKVGLHTRVDVGGMFSVDKADAALELIEVVAEATPANASANGTAANATAGDAAPGGGEGKEGAAQAGAAGGSGAAGKEAGKGKGQDSGDPTSLAAAAAAMAKAAKVRKRTIRVALNVTGGFAVPGLSAEQLAASRKVLRALRAADEAKRETAKAKNDLESYIISTRDKLESDEDLRSVSSEEQRSGFLAALTAAEDWLYDEGDAASAREYRDRLRMLREVGDPIQARLAEKAARPEALEAATAVVELVRKAASSWPSIKPWINASEVEQLLGKVDEFAKWLAGKQGEQEKRAAHEEPAFRSEQVNAWAARLHKAFTRLNNRRKPPPSKPPVANDTAAVNETAAGGEAEQPKADSGDGVHEELPMADIKLSEDALGGVEVLAVQAGAIVDHIVHLDDEAQVKQLIQDEIGGSHRVEMEEISSLLAKAGEYFTKAGGSAANTTRGLASLGVRAAVLGTRGFDEWGALWASGMKRCGVDISRMQPKPGPTGRCCILSCKGTRTMRTCLAGPRTVPEELYLSDFQGVAWCYVSGYLLYTPGLLERSVELARKAGCKIALELGSFEVVRAFYHQLRAVLETGTIDVVFCNEDEAQEVGCAARGRAARALRKRSASCFSASMLKRCVRKRCIPPGSGMAGAALRDAGPRPRRAAQVVGGAAVGATYQGGLEYLAAHADVAVVTLGEKGCLVMERGGPGVLAEPACSGVVVADSTGAGDLFAAGFLLGLLRGSPLQRSAQLGCLAGAAVVQILGSELGPSQHEWLHSRMHGELAGAVVRDSAAAVQQELLAAYALIEKKGRGVVYYGSARLRADSPHWQRAVDLGRGVAHQLGCTTWSGGGPGMMEAATVGALEAGKPVAGIRISREAGTTVRTASYLPEDSSVFCRFLSSRKVALVDSGVRAQEADRTAYIFLPGGLGTLDELFEILTLVQLRKLGSRFPVPVILADYDGFWASLFEFLKACVLNGTVGAPELKDLVIAAGAHNAEVLAYLAEFYGLPGAPGPTSPSKAKHASSLLESKIARAAK
eukprot:scaffold3.g6297.t1